jgi:hypothetical protein
MRIRDAALMRFAMERALAADNFEETVRLHNCVERREHEFRAAQRKRARTLPPSLGDYLSRQSSSS